MKAKVAFTVIAATVLSLLVPAVAHGEGITCGTPTLVLADGRVTRSSIGAGTTFVFQIPTTPGRSYTFEVTSDTAAFANSPFTVLLLDQQDTCPGGPSTLATTETQTNDPRVDFAVRSNGFRQSFIAPAGDNLVLVAITNNTAGTRTYSYSASETSLFSPAWSTFGAFETFYSLVNTTRSPISATLKLFNTAGAEVASFDFNNIPANGTMSTNTGTLAVGNNQNGLARITHDGPPGALMCEAAIANFSVTPNIIQPVTCAAVRESTH